VEKSGDAHIVSIPPAKFIKSRLQTLVSLVERPFSLF
jgi:hypothetical protein